MHRINRNELINKQPNVDPFLFIGDVQEIEIRKKILSNWELREDYWFFRCHWPNNPNVPGAIQLEAVIQTSSLMFFADPQNKNDYIYISKINLTRFFHKLRPLDVVQIDCQVTKLRRGIAQIQGKMTRNSSLVMQTNFELFLQNEVDYVSK